MAGNKAGALKGWANRQAAFERRSEAALKGWETRRQNKRNEDAGLYYEAPVFFEDDIYEIDY